MKAGPAECFEVVLAGLQKKQRWKRTLWSREGISCAPVGRSQSSSRWFLPAPVVVRRGRTCVCVWKTKMLFEKKKKDARLVSNAPV